jgi:hypothetical protein
MPYTAQFFAEKLNIPVEYFNPLRNAQIDPSVNLEELARVAHSLGEVVGLGLRNLANCPVEMNLMPDSTLRWQAFDQKKPYFIATIFSVVLVAFAVGFLFEKLAQSKEAEIEKLSPQVETIQLKTRQFKSAYSALEAVQGDRDQITSWLEDRYYWGDVLTQLRGVLIGSEDETRKKLSAQKPNVEAGIWIEQLTTDPGLQGGTAVASTPPVDQAATPNPDQSAPVNVVCRAVNLSAIDPSANSEIAYAVESELKACPIFDPKTTQLTGQITPDDSNGTFTFGISLILQNPLKL